MPYVFNPVADIAEQWKGTYDLASVAEMLMHRVPLVWTMNPNNFSGMRSANALFQLRFMCCFEFIHLAAYLAGRQLSAGTAPRLGSGEAQVVDAPTVKTWTAGPGNLMRGKIVLFIAWGTDRRVPPPWMRHSRYWYLQEGLNLLTYNNGAGYYHVGIARGDGTVISLSSGKNIHVERLTDADDVYAEVRSGNYDWFGAQGDATAPKLP